MDFETLYREERPRALATLIRLLGDFDLAEETLQEAFAAAARAVAARRASRATRAPGSSPRRGTRPSTACGAQKSFAASETEIAYLAETPRPRRI